MRSGLKSNKKFKYGSVSVALTVLVIAAVIVLNVVFGALADKYLWYIDLTQEQIYTLTDACEELLDTQFDALDLSRGEADKNNVATNNDRNTKNDTTILKNEQTVNSASSENLKGLFAEVKSAWSEIKGEADKLASISGETDKNTAVDATNKLVIKLNKKLDKLNEQIDALNKDNQNKNDLAGVGEGDSGYIPMVDKLENIETYARINGEIKVEIIFCDDPDVLDANSTQRFVHETAKQLQKKFPDIISIEYIDIWTNPTAVQQYKLSTYDKIYSTDVIITSGTEFRVLKLENFYVFSENESEPWGYNGEKKLAAAILGVTRAESPIACLTYNHDEKTSYDLYYLLEDAGYEVVLLDLLNEEIPENCRLILSCGPGQDFFGYDKDDPDSSLYKKSEIRKLDEFLDGANSFMVFVSPTTPKLPNLEEYLEEWGVVIDRHSDEEGTFSYNYMINDTTQSLTSDGFTIFGEYTQNGLGHSVTEDMQTSSFAPKMVFKNPTSFSLAPSYTLTHEEDNAELETEEHDFGLYMSNGITRKMYNLFTSSANATAFAGGKKVADASATDLFSLMTITQETRIINDTSYSSIGDPSNVCVCGSTEFYSENFLQSSVYGNSELLMTLFGFLSREVVAVSLDPKAFADTTISSITTSQMTAWTLCLTLIPAAIIFTCGLVVIIRRKYS